MARIKHAFYLLVVLSFLSGCSLIPMPPWTPGESPAEPSPALPTETLPAYPIGTSSPITPTATRTPEDTQTLTTESPSPLPQPEFILQEGSPFYLPNFTHPEAGCAWLGIAGQVFDSDGTELQGLIVRSGDYSALTGDAIAYGPGGFEIQVGSAPINSNGVYDIQILDNTGQPLSSQTFITTYQDCEKNLVLVNFVRADEDDFQNATPTIDPYP